MNEALDDGSHYMAIYEFCGFVFIGLAAAYLCLAIGTINLKSRIAGLGTLCLMSVCNFIALIVTAVYRFNTLGKLAALSTCPTKYDKSASDTYYVTDDWTYTSEANMIAWVWSLQLITCIFTCCVNHRLNKLPRQSEIRYRTASTADEFEALSQH